MRPSRFDPKRPRRVGNEHGGNATARSPQGEHRASSAILIILSATRSTPQQLSLLQL